MPRTLDPFRFVLIAVAGWMNQRQLQIIDYLREENRVLREQLGGRRVRLNDDQRRRLAAKAKGLGRKLLAQIATIVTPETLLAGHRKLIARTYDSSGKRGPGRPRTAGEIEALVVRMAEENRDWGYRRIQGASSNLGHELAPSTIAEILEGHGIEPAPERSPQSRSSMSMPNDNEGAASLHDRRRAGSICRGFALYGLTVQHSCLLPQRDGRCLPVSAIHLDSGQFRISDGAP